MLQNREVKTHKKYRKALFIFRRDMRLVDNCGLNRALKECDEVIPCFIFDPRQIEKNSYFSDKGFAFLLQSLVDLEIALKKQNGKLYLFSGGAEDVVGSVFKTSGVEAVYINRDYTPFSHKRDSAIEKASPDLIVSGDSLLNEPGQVLKSDGKPYSVFTPFMRQAKKLPVGKPEKTASGHFYTGKITGENQKFFKILIKKYDQKLLMPGGRSEGLKLLSKIEDQKEYEKERNFPSLNSTTHLSPHLKFGTVSAREVYEKVEQEFSKNHPLIDQLYWRDFFSHIAFHSPHVFGHSFHWKYRSLKWSGSEALFKKWCLGQTGFPIVDAGMRELNQTGYMHNRVRMIVASFLVKDLHIDWRKGERYFATQLIDYDPAVNNGNWQWAASTGCDAQPYFRIFNPWRQQERFDKECIYIKKWVPELKEVGCKTIHSPVKLSDAINSGIAGDYLKPIVDHKKESERAKAQFKGM